MAATPGEVLIVDDTPANLQLLTGLLKSMGYSVRSVPSGELALRAAETQPPDAILLDINMPGMDGYEVCRRLKQDPRLCEIPVLFISALSEPLDKVRAFKVGGVDYVTKPFQVEEVQARIETHVRLRRLRGELEEKNHALEASNAQLRETERLRDTLTHMIVHDMRSPLMAVLASFQILRIDLSGELSADNEEDLQRGEDCVQDIVRMINDLLDVGRLDAGAMPVERSRSELGALVRRAVESLGARTRNRTIDLSQLDPATQLECDAELIRRVIVNLLDNALKWNPADAAVRVRAQHERGLTRIEVSDRGPGIPKEAHSLIFEKFGQAKQTHKTGTTGLGLAFCRLAVEAHGGTIGVISEPGQGSTFWFTLPSA